MFYFFSLFDVVILYLLLALRGIPLLSLAFRKQIWMEADSGISLLFFVCVIPNSYRFQLFCFFNKKKISQKAKIIVLSIFINI